MIEKILEYLKSSHDFYDRLWTDATEDEDRQYYMGATVAYGAAQAHIAELLSRHEEELDARLS